MMKRYITILNILLIAGVVFFVVKALYKVATANIDSSPPLKETARHIVPQETEKQHELSYYNAIHERNLFKTGTAIESQPEKLDIETLKATDLNLKLLGTITGDEKKACAVIEDTAVKRQDLYRIGDTIQNATLKMILREKVVLNVNGKDEVLGIEKPEGGQGVKTSSTPSRRLPVEGSQNIAVKRSEIESAITDVNNLMKQIRIQPHFTNGKPDGLRLTGIRPNSVFYNMGLKSGDIITGVNGKNIESVDDAIKFYQNLQSSSRAQLQVKRRGQLKTIDYNIE